MIAGASCATAGSWRRSRNATTRARGYYAIAAPHARDREDVAAFVAWLAEEAAWEQREAKQPKARKAALVKPRAARKRKAAESDLPY